MVSSVKWAAHLPNKSVCVQMPAWVWDTGDVQAGKQSGSPTDRGVRSQADRGSGIWTVRQRHGQTDKQDTSKETNSWI